MILFAKNLQPRLMAANKKLNQFPLKNQSQSSSKNHQLTLQILRHLAAKLLPNSSQALGSNYGALFDAFLGANRSILNRDYRSNLIGISARVESKSEVRVHLKHRSNLILTTDRIHRNTQPPSPTKIDQFLIRNHVRN